MGEVFGQQHEEVDDGEKDVQRLAQQGARDADGGGGKAHRGVERSEFVLLEPHRGDAEGQVQAAGTPHQGAFTHVCRALAVCLKAHLCTAPLQILEEIFEMETTIGLLKRAIEERAPYMKVAQTRVEARLRRPNMENTRDHAQNKYVSGGRMVDCCMLQ